MRFAILQRLEIAKRATAFELAERLGRPVTALYHHLKQLHDVGLLRIEEERKGSRRPAVVYALVAEQLSSAEAVKSKRGRKTLARAAVRVADAGARAFSAAVADGEPIFEGSRRNAMVRYFMLRADKKKIARLNELLNELDDAAGDSSEVGEEIQLTILLSPSASRCG